MTTFTPMVCTALDAQTPDPDNPPMTYVEREDVLVTEAGRRIGWIEFGPSAGRPVGYLHGMPGSRRDLHAVFSRDLLERFGLRIFAIDRGGYGDTEPAGLDRRDVARDLLTTADHLGIDSFTVLAVSMGGTYALTVAALAPERVDRLVLVVPQALPYDDPEVIAALGPDEQDEVVAARRGHTAEYEQRYVAETAQLAGDCVSLVRDAAANWHPLEQQLVATAWGERVGASLEFGLSRGHRGYYEDALRTVRPLEIELADVRCPVRIVAGSRDEWEPIGNARRLAERLSDVTLMELHGMGHFGAWVWPDLVPALVVGG